MAKWAFGHILANPCSEIKFARIFGWAVLEHTGRTLLAMSALVELAQWLKPIARYFMPVCALVSFLAGALQVKFTNFSLVVG